MSVTSEEGRTSEDDSDGTVEAIYEVDARVPPETARRLEAAGMEISRDEKASSMSEALRAELVRICTDGDSKNKGTFTIAVCAHVEKFAASARDILAAEAIARNDLSALLMNRRRKKFGYGNVDLVGNDDLLVGSNDSLEAASLGIPFVGGSSNENFGVQAIRQLVEGMRGIHDSPARLVEALALAREKNLPDVATAIEKKLGITTKKTEEAGK